jgi:hypothetical protein
MIDGSARQLSAVPPVSAVHEENEPKENDMAHRARALPKSPSKKIELTYRDCLRCDQVFPSEGPYNRLCKTCLEYLATSPTPAEEYSIGYL